MTTEITRTTGNGDMIAVEPTVWPALDETSEVAETMEANLSGEPIHESDLIRVTVPSGGGTMWSWTDLQGERNSKTLEGLLVYRQARGVLWPHETPSGSMPLMVTNDLVKGWKRGDDYGDIDPEQLEQYLHPDADGSYDWPRLPWNQWVDGQPPRCRETRLLFLLQEHNIWPLLIIVPPSSLQTMRPFLKLLPLPHYRCMISLALRKNQSPDGIDYAQIVPRLVGCIDKEAGKRIKQLYTDALSDVAHRVEVRV